MLTVACDGSYLTVIFLLLAELLENVEQLVKHFTCEHWMPFYLRRLLKKQVIE